MGFGHRTPLRGRDDQLADAATVLRAATVNGRAGAVLIRGRPGGGKSRLFEAVIDRANREGLTVLHGSGDADAATMPMAPLLQAVLRGPTPLMDRATVQQAMGNEEVRYILIQDIAEAIERSARSRALVIAIDDLQFCDTTTLFALRVLTEQLAAEPVVWLVAAREPVTDDTVARTLDRLQQLDSRTLLATPLPLPAALAIAEDIVGATLDANLRTMVARADGEVLDLVETLRGLVDEHRIQLTAGHAVLADTKVPTRLRDSVGRQLARLTPLAAETVTTASVVGRRFSPQVIAALLGQPLREIAQALRQAESIRIVSEVNSYGSEDQFTFRHDLIREALELTLTPAVRRELRRAAVDAQLARGMSVVEVAGALAASAEPGDLEAAELLEQAAQHTAAMDPSTGADLLARAAELARDDPTRRDRLVARQVSLLWQAGRSRDAQELGEQALVSGLDPAHEAEVRLGLARVAAEHSYTEAGHQTSTALALPALPDAIRAQLYAGRAVAKIVMHDFEGLDGDLAAGLELADRSGALPAQASLLATKSTLAFYQMDWPTAFSLAAAGQRIAETAAAETSMWTPGSLWTAILWGVTGSPKEALGILDGEIADATARQQGAALALLMMVRARVLLEAGRLSDAQSEAEAVLTMTDWRDRNSVADFTVNFVLRRVAQYTGDPDALRRTEADATRLTQEAVASVRRPGKWLAALDADADGNSALALELTAEGVAAYGRLGDAFTFDPADEPLFARIAARAGRPDLAARAAVYTEERATRNPTFPLLAALARHTRGLVDDNPDALGEAVALFADTQRPLPQAAALEDAGRVTADRDKAVDLLDQAHAIYRETGALRDAARIRQRLRTLGVRRAAAKRDGSGDLTPSELAVARLVARGSTNREVAAELFLSPHTVNSHLRHAFTKLGIRSRVELARIPMLSDTP